MDWETLKMKRFCLIGAIALAVCGCGRGGPDARTGSPDARTTAPGVTTGTGDTPGPIDTSADPSAADMTPRDNTGVNERDAGGSTVTPFDQSNDQADIDLVAAIRSRVVDIDNLSVQGRNVKIITNRGRVVLRGPVASVEEREAIASIAQDLAGPTMVNNQLEVNRN
jgi:hyperosmotically inducible periplasmic protein